MSIINLPVGLTDPNNLVPVVSDYAALVPAMDDFLGWYSARLKYLSLDESDNVAEALSRDGAGNAFAIANPALRPSYIPDQIGGFGALDFDGGNHLAWPAEWPSGDHTKVVLFRASSFGTTKNILGYSAGERHMLYVSGSGDLRAAFGSGAGETVVVEGGLNLVAGKWHLAICSWDQSTGTGKLSLDGGTPITATNALAAPSAPQLNLGSGGSTSSNAMTGQISDVMLFSGDLLGAGRADDLLVIKSYYRDVYGID